MSRPSEDWSDYHNRRWEREMIREVTQPFHRGKPRRDLIGPLNHSRKALTLAVQSGFRLVLVRPEPEAPYWTDLGDSAWAVPFVLFRGYCRRMCRWQWKNRPLELCIGGQWRRVKPDDVIMAVRVTDTVDATATDSG